MVIGSETDGIAEEQCPNVNCCSFFSLGHGS